MSASKVTQNKPTNASEVRLVEVLDAYLAAAQEGRAPTRGELLAGHPELAEDLEACLASLEFIGQASLTAAPMYADSKAAEADEGAPGIGDLGDFRLVKEVGRGGMGVVYEAVQRSLNRRVALKVLPFAAAMDPTQLRRFQTEALAAAQLHHTHIVPVFSVGCERGVHYYAMQFIEGQTLAQAIAERRRLEAAHPSPLVGEGGPQGRMGGPLAEEGGPQGRMGGPLAGDGGPQGRMGGPLAGEGGPQGRMGGDPVRRGSPDPAETTDRTSPIAVDAPTQRSVTSSATPSPSSRSREYFRTAASLGIQAAEALDNAHKVGIVHRDIKPANLLLDVQGNLWVTDFGLARLRDDTGLTISGDLLGTLRYMSPEQALARRMVIDHRTDIYSLGATLYELVTLHPAIDGQDRQEILRKIAQEEPTPPRRLNPAIPRELETILLKAIAKEPESRYATAQELADDLRRFLEHKPIRAKPPNLVERTAKWSRRHPTLVVSSLLTLSLVVIGLSVSLFVVNRERAVTAERTRDVERLSRKLAWELYVSRVSQAYGDWRAGNLLRANEALAACREDLRNWEWRHVQRLCHTERYSVEAHHLSRGMGTVPVCFAPDGMRWISAAGNPNLPASPGGLKFWETSTGVCLRDFGGDALPSVQTLAVSSVGGTLAVGYVDANVAIDIRDLDTGRLRGKLATLGPWGQTRRMAFSPDGKRLADLRALGRLVLWDLAEGKPIFDIPAHGDVVWALAYHPREEMIATGGRDGMIRLWNARTGDMLRSLNAEDRSIFDVAFSPDGTQLASGGWNQTVRTWDVASGTPLLVIPGHDGFVQRLTYSPEGSRLAIASGQAIVLRDTATGRESRTIPGESYFGAGLDFSPDGTKLVVSARSGRVQLFDTSFAEPRILRTADWVNSLSFSPDGRRLVAALDNSELSVWDLETPQACLRLRGHLEQVRTAAFSPDGTQIISASWDGTVGIWDAFSERRLQVLATSNLSQPAQRSMDPPGGNSINFAEVSPDGRLLATAGWDKRVRIWDLNSGTELRSYGSHRDIVWCVSFSPDSRKIASIGGDRRIRVWEVATGRDLWSVASGSVPFAGMTVRRVVAFSPDGRLLAGCVDFDPNPSPIVLWDAVTGAKVHTLGDSGVQVNCLAFSPDGTRLALAGEDRIVQLWDVASGQNVFMLRGHISSVLSVAFSPDGTKLASGSTDATVRIWDAPRGLSNHESGQVQPSRTTK